MVLASKDSAVEPGLRTPSIPCRTNHPRARATDLHGDIARCCGRICKRILAIHIYRGSTLPGRRFRRSVGLFRALSPSPLCSASILTLSLFLSTRHRAVGLCRHRRSRQSALAEIGGKRDCAATVRGDTGRGHRRERILCPREDFRHTEKYLRYYLLSRAEN